MATMPPMLGSLADSFYLQQQQTARSAAAGAQALWREQPATGLADKFAYWRTVIPDLADVVALGQAAAVAGAATYATTAAVVQGVTVPSDVPRVNASAFLADSSAVQEWLSAAMLHQARLVLQGAPPGEAQRLGLSTLVRQVATLTQDAGREATGAGIVSIPGMDGYFRRLRTPSCSRCAVLAGGYYKAATAFDRHPRCDCEHVPAAEHYDDGVSFDAEEAIRRGQVTGLSKADRQAILDDGADVSQVINAKRHGSGMSASNYLAGGERAATTSSTTRRGVYHVENSPRLTPAAIYKRAGGDKAKARDLLQDYGYLA